MARRMKSNTVVEYPQKLPMVLVVSMPLVSGAPPARIFPAGLPLPASPWHIAHLATKIGAPCAAVPLPAGKPVPSGRMLMSQAVMSASEIRAPSPGVCASAAPEPTRSAQTASGLSVDMFDLPFAVDRPTREAVVVLVGEAERIRRFLGLAALGDELGAQRLHAAGLVPGAALQYHRPAVPAPGHAEARERLGQHRLLQRGLAPALAAVGRHQHLGYSAVARIGDAGDLVEARPFERVAERRVGDEGLHFLQEVEAESLAAGQELRIGARLVVGHRRLVDQFD